MNKNRKILVLAGDGIGPEVMKEVLLINKWLDKNFKTNFEISERLVGGAAYDAEGDSISDATIEEALNSDAVLFGAVGGDKWNDVKREKRPEAALLRLRKEMDLFANLRPAIAFDALTKSSSLKENLIKGLDILIVRELTSGVYFGKPKGIETLKNNEKKAVDTQSYSTSEIKRIAEIGFDLSKKRNKVVTSVDKANVMETGLLWRNIVNEVHAEKYNDIDLSHMYADNCAMQLVRNPKQFDVIITDNLFGDILSDCAAMLTGSLGMLPSASLGAINIEGKRLGMYEPVHGSAPDIAGKDIANPLAMILSFSMMLNYSFNMIEESSMIDKAVQSVLAKGNRTKDIAEKSENYISTSSMGMLLIEELNKILES
ncbi:MAG: 3-isopropylmalate dehydrogenase [Alphaproteobacteria bacterium MarineAlpha5_Bin9]|nr:MAG: 3-isopropylmalate dehydrogenase [Alphaproteobacteria bacterium MarineAlpha5_Bin9]|tara:strand:+ start:3420 stop:4535 length:1116 start_codon:yes stop_codon:yes gene_type:complete